MPLADLPYRIERLARDGQYAYLARIPVKVKDAAQPEVAADKKKSTRLRVLRYVTLCDGPALWDGKKAEEGEELQFFVKLRLFASRSTVNEYLTGPEVLSFSQSTGGEVPVLADGDLVISESNFTAEAVSDLAEREYVAMLQSRDSNVSLESLEQMVSKAQGISDQDGAHVPKKRGRKPKVQPPVPEPAPPPSQSSPEKQLDEDSDEESPDTSVNHSDRPAASDATPAPSKPPAVKKRPLTLRDQFAQVQNTPSRVVDVSGFGDTMHHQKGRVLDRVRHSDRIAQCTVLSDLFPVVSDNIPAFERAMVALGTRYLPRVAEFKTRHCAKSQA